MKDSDAYYAMILEPSSKSKTNNQKENVAARNTESKKSQRYVAWLLQRFVAVK